MLGVLHATHAEFRTGWFVESLATQTLVIFVIRTRRLPFWRSRPSTPLLLASLIVPLVGIALPYLPFGHAARLHAPALRVLPDPRRLVVAYLALVEQAKATFYRTHVIGEPLAAARPRPRAAHLPESGSLHSIRASR